MTEPTATEVLRQGAAIALLFACGVIVAPLEAITVYSMLNPPFATGAIQLALMALPVLGVPAWFLCPREARPQLFAKTLLYASALSLLVLVLLCGRIKQPIGTAAIPAVVLLLQLGVGLALMWRAPRTDRADS